MHLSRRWQTTGILVGMTLAQATLADRYVVQNNPDARAPYDTWATAAVPLGALVGGDASGHYWRINMCRNLYDARGSFVQGLTLARPGYYSPGIPLVLGAVRASTLLATVNATLAELEGPMKAHLSGAIKRQFEQLTRYRGKLAVAPDAAVPMDEAAAMLETALDHAGKLRDRVIWNYLFE